MTGINKAIPAFMINLRLSGEQAPKYYSGPTHYSNGVNKLHTMEEKSMFFYSVGEASFLK